MQENTWHEPSIPCDLPGGTKVRLHWDDFSIHELTLTSKARCEASVGDAFNKFRIVAIGDTERAHQRVHWRDETGEHDTGLARCSQVLLPATIAPMPETDWHLPTEPCDLPTGTLLRWHVPESGKTIERELLEPCVFTRHSDFGHVTNKVDKKIIQFLERAAGDWQNKATSISLLSVLRRII